MGNYTILEGGGGRGFENPRRVRRARNLTTNVPKILDLKSFSEQIFSKSCRWVPLTLLQNELNNDVARFTTNVETPVLTT